MSCEQHRSELQQYSQSDASADVKSEARKLYTDLLGACGIANSFRTHTSRLLADQSIEGATQMQKIWGNKQAEAIEFLEQNPLPNVSQQ